ncbi:universal stress protein [Haloterrigena sp. SYSU A121-1]|uniref:Universal stress protein n=1 Tax=Haloterrigena gelatinilytica TaxID=2741724 RepID=A0A8J8GPF7_9EURY|nr:universal stress protein [Haloterrigena gelatinilytica]NUB93541.1 universal stress protein [Haloterrigena gelatinilytica]
MYSDVLLATDGSECARAATTHAIDLAATYGATLHALYVMETRTGYDSDIVDPATIEDELRAEGEAVLEGVSDESRARDVALVDRIRKGVPEREIADYVEAEDVDIVVLGSRGESAFKTVLLGSTSEALVRDLSVPVVLVSDGDGETESTA